MPTHARPPARPLARPLAATLLLLCAGAPHALAQQQGSEHDIESDLVALTPHAGRAAGTPGHAAVAEFLRERYRQLGLIPAISDDAGEASFDQKLESEGNRPVMGASLRYIPEEVEGGGMGGGEPIVIPAANLEAHWATGPGIVEAAGVFTGYSIVSGPGGYMSFAAVGDLSGSIAFALRGEPMDDQGESLWTKGEGWSFRASSMPKVIALSRRNAAAVVLITPPGASDPDSAEQTQQGVAKDFHFEVPVLTISAADADRIFAAADPEGRTITELRKLADAEPIIQNLTGRFEVGIEMAQEAEPINNIVGMLAGKGDLAHEIVLVTAHYDSVPAMPAANNNASGVAAMLSAAELLTESYEQELDLLEHARSIVFLAAGLGEDSADGITTYLESVNPNGDAGAEQPVVAALILDTLGKSDRRMTLKVIGVNSGEGMSEWIEPIFEHSIFEINASDLRRSFGEQLTTPFDAGIPAIMFSTGFNRADGTISDTAQSIDLESVTESAELIAEIALELAFHEDRFATDQDADSIKPKKQERRPVRLGVQPAFKDDEEGVLIRRVFDETSASDAGLLAGDRLTRWNDEPILVIDDFVLQLSLAKPGDEVTFTVERDGETLQLELTLRGPGE